MSHQRTLTVHNFRLFRLPVESPEIAPYKATLEAIRAVGGEPIPGTAQDVSADEVDDNGHYRRHNTGWGPLE